MSGSFHLQNIKRLLVVSCLPISAFAQISFSGKVIDKKTTAPVPFATVGLVKENIGRNAEADGSFTITSARALADDSLIISCVGFATVRLPVAGLVTINLQITLEEIAGTLQDVVVTNKTNWIYTALNDFHKSTTSSYTSNGSQVQMALPFISPSAHSQLSRLKIHINKPFSSRDEPNTFRIRVFDMDSMGKQPSIELTTAPIDITANSGVLEMDFSNYHIYLDHIGFFVSIEWLKIEANERKSMSQVLESTENKMTYGPYIGMEMKSIAPMDSWSLNYQNRWTLLPSSRGWRFYVSPTVKY